MRLAAVIAMIVVSSVPRSSAADADKALVVDVSRDGEDAKRTIRRVGRDLAAAGYASADQDVVEALSSKWARSNGEARIRRFEAAKEAFSLFELDRALALLAELDSRSAEANPDEIREQLAERYVLEAVIQHSRGQRGAAIRAFRLAHRLVADDSLDSGKYQPEIVALYRKAVRANARAKPRQLALRTSPTGARVFVDGRSVTTKRGRVQIDAGPHLVRLTYPGHTSVAKRIDDEESIELALLPRKGDARLASLAAEVRDGDRRWRDAAAGELASAADAALVVLVRGKKAAIYRSATGERGPWIRVRSQSFANELSAVPAASEPVTVTDNTRRQRTPHTGGSDQQRWYQKPWVWVAIAGAVAIGGGTIAVVANSGQTQEQIGSFCFQGACQ
jgi:hypothetical protein